MMKPRQLKHAIPTRETMSTPFSVVTTPCRIPQTRLRPIISALLTLCVLQGNGIAHARTNSDENKDAHWQMPDSTTINQKEEIMKTQIVNSSQAGSNNNTTSNTSLATSGTSMPNALAAKPPLTTLHDLQTDSLSLQTQALKATGNITTNSTLNISSSEYLGSSGNLTSKYGSVILESNNTLISGGSVNAPNGSASIGSTQGGTTSITNASINAGNNVNIQGGGVSLSGTIRAGGNIKITGKNVQISGTTIQSTDGSVQLGGTEKTEVLATTIDANHAQIGNADSKTSVTDVSLKTNETQIKGNNISLSGDIDSRGDLNAVSDNLSSSANVSSSDGQVNLSANTTQITGGDIRGAQGATVGKPGGTVAIQSGLQLQNVTVQGKVVPLASEDADSSDKTKP